MQEQQKVSDWSEEYLQDIEKLPEVPKLKDGENVEIVFQDEGKEVEGEFGKSIFFRVLYQGKLSAIFFRKTWFDALKSISKNKPVVGKKAVYSRTGTTRKDTRREVKFLGSMMK